MKNAALTVLNFKMVLSVILFLRVYWNGGGIWHRAKQDAC